MNLLKNICPEAWKLIATTFENNVAIQNEGDVAEFATNVAIFNEGLLRSILPLTSSQQTELVRDLISGSITKGRFKSLAQAYKARNEMEEYTSGKGIGISTIETALTR